MVRTIDTFRKVIPPERNIITNSGLDNWQRGTSGFTTSGQYSADRFLPLQSHSASFSIDRDTDLPIGAVGQYSLKFSVTTGAATGVNDWSGLQHRIEASDIQHLAGKYVTLSFWYKSNVTGKHSFTLIETGPQLIRYTHEFQIDYADTWIPISHTFQIYPTADWGSGVAKGATLAFNTSIGSNFHAPNDTWVTNGGFGTATMVDLMSTTSNYFKISDIMFHEGSKAVPFSRRGNSLAEELQLCQRYYEKSYLQSVAPGSISDTGKRGFNVGTSTTSNFAFHLFFMTLKRDIPLITTYSPVTGASGKGDRNGTDTNAVPFSASEYGCLISDTGTNSAFSYWCHFTADSEI